MPVLHLQNQWTFQTLITDFGKATRVENGRKYNLSPVEIAEYARLYSHLPPEVIEGKVNQSRSSDIYLVELYLPSSTTLIVLTTLAPWLQ